MYFIDRYANSADIQSAINDGTLLKPYLALDDSTGLVDWNSYTPSPTPSGYSDQYLTFDIISAGTIVWRANNSIERTIQYSLDNGSTWTSITSSAAGTSFNVNVGDKVLFKGNNDSYATSSSYFCHFNGSTARFNAYGNIMSLIGGDNFTELTTLNANYTFLGLFGSTRIVDASNLILPATSLTTGCCIQMFQDCTKLTQAPALPAIELKTNCYANMFSNCTKLTQAPELPAPTLKTGCYSAMFYGCTSLKYIKCLATTLKSGSTNGWVINVPASGTFVKASSMSSWTTGVNGIPTGWTVQDAS